MAEGGDNWADVCIVTPAYHEAAMIAQVIDGLARYVSRRQVIVVDDASTDQTAALAQEAGATVVRHAVNCGQGAALATGVEAALRQGAKIIITFDADGQHDPDDLPAMIEPIVIGLADVVLGTRFSQDSQSNVPMVRKILLKLAVCLTRLTTRLPVTDAHNGYRALSAKAAKIIRIRQNRMEHASEILDEIARHRLRYVERPVNIRYSEYSLAKGQKNRAALKMAIRMFINKAAG